MVEMKVKEGTLMYNIEDGKGSLYLKNDDGVQLLETFLVDGYLEDRKEPEGIFDEMFSRSLFVEEYDTLKNLEISMNHPEFINILEEDFGRHVLFEKAALLHTLKNLLPGYADLLEELKDTAIKEDILKIHAVKKLPKDIDDYCIILKEIYDYASQEKNLDDMYIDEFTNDCIEEHTLDTWNEDDRKKIIADFNSRNHLIIICSDFPETLTEILCAVFNVKDKDIPKLTKFFKPYIEKAEWDGSYFTTKKIKELYKRFVETR